MSGQVIKNVRTIFDVNAESGSIRVEGTAQAVDGEIRDFNGSFYHGEEYVGSLYYNNKNGNISRNMQSTASVNSECSAAFDNVVAGIEQALLNLPEEA